MRALPSSFYGYFKFPPKVVLFSSAISRADVASCDLIPTKNHKPRTEQESECMGSIINGLPALPVRNYAWQTQIKCRNCATWKSGLVARDPFPIPRTKRMSSNYKLHNQINLAKPYNLFILPKHIETHTNWFQTGNCNFLPNKVACIGVEYIYILWAGHTDWPAYCQQNTNQINYTEGPTEFGLRLAAVGFVLLFEFVLKSLSCYLSLIRTFVHIVIPVITPLCCYYCGSVRRAVKLAAYQLCIWI